MNSTKRCVSEGSLDLLLKELEPKDLEKEKIDLDEQELVHHQDKHKNNKKQSAFYEHDYSKEKASENHLRNESNHNRDHAKKKVSAYRKQIKNEYKGLRSLLTYIYGTTNNRCFINESNVESVEETNLVKKVR